MTLIKQLSAVTLIAATLAITPVTTTIAQHKKAPATLEEKMKRPSPPVSISETIKSGATITINYSQPSLKGRVPGKDIEPFDNKVWRAGANEATTFETTKEVSIGKEKLPAGKYALFTLNEGGKWEIIFNKVWDTWGAFSYEKNKEENALIIAAKLTTLPTPAEKLLYSITKKGVVTLSWGNDQVSFTVK